MRRELVRLCLVAALSSLLGGLGGWVLAATGLAEEIEGPFVKEEGAQAAAFNAALFVALLLAGALLLVGLVRIRLSLVKALGYFAFFMAALVVGEVYSAACGADPTLAFLASLALASAATLAAALRPLSPPTVAAQIAVGALTGSIIAAMVPPTSMLAMIAAAAAYDLYTVYKGPLKRLIERVRASQGRSEEGGARTPSPLTPLAVNLGGMALGMGDVVLYGAMSSVALLAPSVDVPRMLLVAASTAIGAGLTLKLVEKRGYAPALPLPAALSLAAYLFYNALKGA